MQAPWFLTVTPKIQPSKDRSFTSAMATTTYLRRREESKPDGSWLYVQGTFLVRMSQKSCSLRARHQLTALIRVRGSKLAQANHGSFIFRIEGPTDG